jgi:O-antigen ligase
MTLYGFRYGKALMAALMLFGLSLALSKSASNVLIAFVFFATILFAAHYSSFRKIIVNRARQPLLLPLFLYFGIALVGVLFTAKMSDGIGVVDKSFGLLLVYVLVAILLDSIEDRETSDRKAHELLFFFLAGIFILNVIGITTFFGIIGHKKYSLPLAPLNVHHIWFSNLNALGLYVATAFLLFHPKAKRSGPRLFLFSFLLLAVCCILLSISRTAWFGVLLTAVIITYLVMRNRSLFLVTLATGALACVLLYLLSSVVHDRVTTIVSDISSFLSGNPDTSIGRRLLMWKTAFSMFLANPLTGVGTGDYVATITDYVKKGSLPGYMMGYNQPHNIYMYALATNGFPGFAALLFVFYRSLKFSTGILKSERGGKFFAFIAVATAIHFMIAGMTDSFFNIQILRYSFAFVVGICLRNSILQTSQPQS